MPFVTGNRQRLTVEFRDLDEELFDPSVAQIWVKTPALVETAYTYGTDVEVVRDSLGVYHMEIDCDEPGDWLYGGVCTGDHRGQREKGFHIEESGFTTL